MKLLKLIPQIFIPLSKKYPKVGIARYNNIK